MKSGFLLFLLEKVRVIVIKYSFSNTFCTQNETTNKTYDDQANGL